MKSFTGTFHPILPVLWLVKDAFMENTLDQQEMHHRWLYKISAQSFQFVKNIMLFFFLFFTSVFLSDSCAGNCKSYDPCILTATASNCSEMKRVDRWFCSSWQQWESINKGGSQQRAEGPSLCVRACTCVFGGLSLLKLYWILRCCLLFPSLFNGILE